MRASAWVWDMQSRHYGIAGIVPAERRLAVACTQVLPRVRPALGVNWGEPGSSGDEARLVLDNCSPLSPGFSAACAPQLEVGKAVHAVCGICQVPLQPVELPHARSICARNLVTVRSAVAIGIRTYYLCF